MDNDKVNRWAEAFGMNVIIKYKWIFFALIIVLLAVSFQGMQRMVVDSSNESFLPENDPVIVLNDRFKEIFGNEEFVFVLVEAEDVFSPEALGYIRGLSEDLEKNLPFVKDMVALTDVEYVEARGEQLRTDDLIGDAIPTDAAELREIREKAMSKKMYVNRIVSTDGKASGIILTLERIPECVYVKHRPDFSVYDQGESVILREDIFTRKEAEERSDVQWMEIHDARKLISPAVSKILARHPSDIYKVRTTGIPVVDFEAERVIDTEGGKLGVISLLVAILLLVFIFRGVTAVVAPFLVLSATLVTLYGFMGWFGFPMTMTGMIISPLILVISVSYSIHVINHFLYHFRRHGIRKDAVSHAFRNSTWPCFLTAVTTALGFASFMVVPVKPIREMGILCALGVFIAYFLVMILIPCVYSFGKNRPVENLAADQDNKDNKEIKENKENNNDGDVAGSQWITRWADFVLKHAKTVVVVSCVFLVVVIVWALDIGVEMDTLNMIGDKVNFVKDSKYITGRLGGLYSIEVLVELPQEGMAKQPDVLRAMESIADEVKQWDSVSLTTSVNDILKDLNMTMNTNDEAFYAIPDSRELVAQYLLLYEMSGGENAEDWVDYDYRRLRLSVQLKHIDSEFGERLAAIAKRTEKKMPEGTRISLVGDAPILLKMMDILIVGQIKSVLAALAVIGLIMILILKSIRVGLLAMIPNVFPVIVICGVMGLMGFHIDLMTVMIAPMIIGIAVDDTVHYVIHFRQEFEADPEYRGANRRTFAKVGRAIVFTSVILSAGFAILGFSAVQSMLHMAVLSVVGILAALVADLVITPVLFVYLKPFGRKA